MKETEELVFRNVKLAAKISNVFLPFTSEILTNVLLSEKFNLPNRKYLEFQSGESQIIAEKNSVYVEFNESTRLISLTSRAHPDEEEVIQIFKPMLKSIINFVGKGKLKFQFYEFDITGIQPTKNNPWRVFAQDNNKSKNILEMNQIFGKKVAPFGLRLFPSNHIIDSTDWFEFNIQPFIFVPEKIYQIRTVYRNKNLNNVITSLAEIRTVTNKLIRQLEAE